MAKRVFTEAERAEYKEKRGQASSKIHHEWKIGCKSGIYV